MPTETQTPRLIDANALNELIDIETWFGEEVSINIEVLKKIIYSAPTVETTDDVLMRVIDPMEANEAVAIWFNEEDEVSEAGFRANVGGYYGKGNTIIEAVKKLEASLNQK